MIDVPRAVGSGDESLSSTDTGVILSIGHGQVQSRPLARVIEAVRAIASSVGPSCEERSRTGHFSLSREIESASGLASKRR